jgi:multiple sugar transport system substrate-binding protein
VAREDISKTPATLPIPAGGEAATTTTIMRGITWDHPRGVDSLQAATDAYSEAYPNVKIEWTARPLSGFEDTPVAELAEEYDLLAIDHPHIGDAVRDGALMPLDTLFPAPEIGLLARDSPGPSHQSYEWDGHQWAFGVDAACQVSAYRPDLVSQDLLPSRWRDMAELSAAYGRDRIALAASPTHIWCSLLSLCEISAENSGPRQEDGRPRWWGHDGIAPSVLTAALERLAGVLGLCARESLELDPISLLDEMSLGERYVYCPLVFGYVTYAHERPGAARLRFVNPPGSPEEAVGTVAGGVGLAISANTRVASLAADFLRFVTDPECQGGIYLKAGGQPGLRSVWADPSANAGVSGFFLDTLPTMERAFLRPRLPGYPEYQSKASLALHEMILAGKNPATIQSELRHLWKVSSV